MTVGASRGHHRGLDAVDEFIEAFELVGLHICLEKPNSECAPLKCGGLNGSDAAVVVVRLRRSIRTAGTVVAAPIPRSASPIRFRRSSGMRLAASSPRPNARAARVPT